MIQLYHDNNLKYSFPLIDWEPICFTIAENSPVKNLISWLLNLAF